MLKNVEAASRSVAHLAPNEAAMDEDYWAVIQNSFTVTRGIINLNNGGVSPSPRTVTEALVRYIWAQEDATAYTMWQILEPQCETIRTGLAELFGCDREEIAIVLVIKLADFGIGVGIRAVRTPEVARVDDRNHEHQGKFFCPAPREHRLLGIRCFHAYFL